MRTMAVEHTGMTAATAPVRLTQTVSCAGCAAKLAPSMLAEALAGVTWPSDPRVVVGFDQCDDAAVWRMEDGTLLVSTTDFFTPIVDDPYLYGRVAATNALSDIYAMGGEALFALNILHYPEALGPDILRAVLQGGAAACAEAGCAIVGGHSVKSPEMTYGLAVTGRIPSGNRIIANAGAQPGDRLVLSKALGTGMLATALKKGLLAVTDGEALIASLTRLNAEAARAMQRHRVHSGCDITGFGLVGHGAEVASASGVRLVIDTASLPLLSGVSAAVAAGCVTRGDAGNRAYAGKRLQLAAGLDRVRELACTDPQSSGGLLLSVHAADADALVHDLRSHGDTPACIVGEVLPGPAAIELR
jgi:selenide,water dikinase